MDSPWIDKNLVQLTEEFSTFLIFLICDKIKDSVKIERKDPLNI